MKSPPKPAHKAVILAAGVGSRIRPLTDDCPKSLLSVAGTPILERMIRNCQSCGISEFVLVLGYLEERIRRFVDDTFPELQITFVVNDKYTRTNTGYSLMLTERAIGGSDFIKFDADVVFDPSILRRLIDSDFQNALCIDRDIQLDAEEVKVIIDDQLRILQASKTVDPKTALGESIGIEKISAETAKLLFAELTLMMADDAHQQDYYEAAYERLMAQGTAFHALEITDLNWTEIDTHDDFATANSLFSVPRDALGQRYRHQLAAASAQGASRI
ncbi:phosphocholine cytidylyltransferase family protein [Pelagibius litoralis]|uniref:Phosphocholine cytidylyltransferase family protein n=1 Tax=Pelagibius litoralis TaxID=374515 RepID=A0A967C8S9_9PROT|nr:phosphocholine cytidylyltransferase family protein [Pelagibius litoralis]NIA68832.1 phosphocholine cytidylyltransferase family protein [Pelagibius litoralis]